MYIYIYICVYVTCTENGKTQVSPSACTTCETVKSQISWVMSRILLQKLYFTTHVAFHYNCHISPQTSHFMSHVPRFATNVCLCSYSRRNTPTYTLWIYMYLYIYIYVYVYVYLLHSEDGQTQVPPPACTTCEWVMSHNSWVMCHISLQMSHFSTNVIFHSRILPPLISTAKHTHTHFISWSMSHI